MNKTIVFGIATLLCNSAIAAQKSQITAEVASVKASENRLIVRSNGFSDIKVNSFLNLGSNCSLEVVKRTANSAALSTELCENKKAIQALKPGQNIKLTTDDSVASQAVVAPTEASNSSSQNDFDDSAPSRTDSRVSTKREESRTDSGSLSSGMRLVLIKDFMDAKAKASKDGESETDSGEVKQSIGIGLGYSVINFQAIGFSAGGILNMYNARESATSLRLSGNATYGMTDMIYGLGGVNLSKFTTGKVVSDLGVGFGFQAGIGIQANEVFGIELAYVTLSNKGTVNGADVDLSMNGLELSAHVTF